MEHASDQERLEYVRNLRQSLDNEGLPTREALVATAPPSVGTVPATPVEAPPSDRAARYRVKAYHTEPYTLPNGEAVFIHPVSLQEASWASLETLKQAKRLRLTREARSEQEKQEQQAQVQVVAQAWLCAYRAVMVCRVGPEPTAARAIPHTDAEILVKEPGWAKALEEVFAISDALKSGQAESELQREMFADFFEAMESALGTFVSQLDTDSWDMETFRGWLEDFAHSVSVLRQRNRWTPAELAMLGRVVRMPEA
jgi:hypothetical protein